MQKLAQFSQSLHVFFIATHVERSSGVSFFSCQVFQIIFLVPHMAQSHLNQWQFLDEQSLLLSTNINVNVEPFYFILLSRNTDK